MSGLGAFTVFLKNHQHLIDVGNNKVSDCEHDEIFRRVVHGKFLVDVERRPVPKYQLSFVATTSQRSVKAFVKSERTAS